MECLTESESETERERERERDPRDLISRSAISAVVGVKINIKWKFTYLLILTITNKLSFFNNNYLFFFLGVNVFGLAFFSFDDYFAPAQYFTRLLQVDSFMIVL